MSLALRFALTLLFILMISYSIISITSGRDWQDAYSNPYWPANIKSYHQHSTHAGPPHALLLIPYAALGDTWGGAINLMLNISAALLLFYALSPRAPQYLLIPLFTSPFFIHLCLVNNIDYLPVFGLFMPLWLAPIFILSKPQIAGAALLIIAKRSRRRPYWLLSCAAIAVLTFTLWDMAAVLAHHHAQGIISAGWNASLFPYMLPLAAYLLWRAWRDDDLWLTIPASACLTPYITIASLFSAFIVILVRWPKIGCAIWLSLWFSIAIRLF